MRVITNNTESEGTTATVKTFRHLLKTTKEARIREIILSGILPEIGCRSQDYCNNDGYQHPRTEDVHVRES